MNKQYNIMKNPFNKDEFEELAERTWIGLAIVAIIVCIYGIYTL